MRSRIDSRPGRGGGGVRSMRAPRETRDALRPSRGDRFRAHRFHEFRCASLVATCRRPSGAACGSIGTRSWACEAFPIRWARLHHRERRGGDRRWSLPWLAFAETRGILVRLNRSGVFACIRLRDSHDNQATRFRDGAIFAAPTARANVTLAAHAPRAPAARTRTTSPPFSASRRRSPRRCTGLNPRRLTYSQAKTRVLAKPRAPNGS